MDKIEWCLNVKNGLGFVEPNSNLAEAYLKKAEKALVSMNQVKAKEWKISTAYYSMYYSLYAILMKIGIKCEIHSCTLEFMKIFLKDYFTDDDATLLERSCSARNDIQYYTDKAVSIELFEKIIKNASFFVIKCKEIIKRLSEEDTIEIRKKLTNFKKVI